MSRRFHGWFAFASLLAVSMAPAVASAQPDIRNIRPVVMLLLDTSGSMERQPACVCSTDACTECVSTCAGTPTRNRWATVVESLTGTYSSYSCTVQQRNTASYVGQYDYRYFMPHVTLPAVAQTNNGILDVYVDRVKFGLMTFDGAGTLTTTNPLIATSTYQGAAFLARTVGEEGMYSYGLNRQYTIPGCSEPYMLNNGARGESATVGGLVSVGDDVAAPSIKNATIQSRILAVRPYGATPIAGMLDDVRYYFDNHTDVRPKPSAAAAGDVYYECRDRYVILLTDGYPNADMREAPYSCTSPGYTCPYSTAEDIAADLCQYDAADSTCTGDIKGLYVVGFDIDDDAAVQGLNDIADVGGTGEALFADDRDTLVATLARALDSIASGTTTRTAPAFALSSASSSVQAQFQFGTGFDVQDSGPWSGVLERKRFLCDGDTLEIEAEDVDEDSNDRFQVVLNNRNLSSKPRKLYTILPNSAANVGTTLAGDGEDLLPDGLVPSGTGPSSGFDLAAFSTSNSALTPAHLGLAASDTTNRTRIINLIHGTTGTTRATRRLGDIYHSSPVVVGPPNQDLPDEAYNLFRQRPEIETRPTVVYVGSNDGILHAFAAEDSVVSRPDGTTVNVTAGEELWGFIAPMLLPKLDSAMTSHQWMMDGTPVVRDVFFARLPGDTPTADQYHTVLISGFRGGGVGYIALDVSDPLDPKFLWQYVSADMGNSTGQAGLGQAFLELNTTLHERAIAILPGGSGVVNTAAQLAGATPDARWNLPAGCPSHGVGRPAMTEGTTDTRQQAKCYTVQGRKLEWIDVATGRLLKSLGSDVFDAPLDGGVSLFTGDTGTIATRAFVTDNDGIVWRIDFGSPDPAEWEAVPFHDIFWDGHAESGQPGYAPPVITTDNIGRVVILQSTGDIDQLDGMGANKIVSILEKVTYNSDGTTNSVVAKRNWEIALATGEQVTGPLELFDGKVYFGSFLSTSSPTNACQYGQSKLWGVDYLTGAAGLESVAGSGTFDVRYLGPYSNQIVMGVAITQRPTCYEGVSETDPYFGGSRFHVSRSGSGQFQLVAQVSGGGTRSSGASIAEIQRDLPTPLAYTSVQAWTGSAE